MASTNAIVKKPVTTTKKSTTTTAKTATSTGTSRSSTISSTGSNVSSTTGTSTTPTQGANTGLFSGLSLASFLGLPAVIDYQDIAIRVGLVVTGVILLILVAWAFVRGKQTQNVTVQASPVHSSVQASAEAVEAVA